MNWVIESLAMFLSSVILYLFVRKSSHSKSPSQYNNLAMFGIPLLVFAMMAVITKQNFLIPFPLFLITIAAGIFFSYLGNAASLISIEKAPNPGYSLVISKSYVVFTTLVAILLFKADLSLKKVLAIILIVGFSSLIMISRKGTKKKIDYMWLPLSIAAFFCWGMLSLTSKYLFNNGVNVFVFLTYVYLVVTICILLEMNQRKINFNSIKTNVWLFTGIGISSVGFNLFQFLAIQSAPNVGYVNAINASSISAVTMCAVLLFKDEFSKRKFIGVVGVTIGLLLLLI